MDKRKREKRIALARDVIAQVQAKRVKVQAGVYCELTKDGDDPSQLPEDELAKTLLKLRRPCEVCAIGTMFVVHMKKHRLRDVPAAMNGDDDAMVEALGTLFSAEEMRMLEQAFECGDMREGVYDYYGTKVNWGDVYKRDSSRLVAMMENIIRNDGVFKPMEVRAPKPKKKPVVRRPNAAKLGLQKPPPMETAQVFGLEDVAPMRAAARATGLLPR